MTKTYCDRCGKEIQGSKYALIRHKTWYAKQLLIPAFVRDDWEGVDKYICPDCEEQYIHWFMNPDMPKEEEHATD